MAHISHRLSNSFEGALAGGGDPATSPLYVFGPFLQLIVVAGVAQITFGASVWLVVLTVAVVSFMYRQVIAWVTDGTGGSGLTEEEFGAWAVKINAGITFVEYTLTFLVSVAALVTLLADRYQPLDQSFHGFRYRTLVAVVLSVLIGWLVNRGPRTAARAFGPATLGVLLLLWVMIIATIWKFGFHLPDLDWTAFSPRYLNLTLGGYSRLLALMTGIEVFANLVAAYEGTPEQRSKKAFRSLLIVMGTTCATMLIVGPAIFKLSDPTNHQISVFTQTMDQLLPQPLAYLGTLIGIVVLGSAAAASAQGLQNLALGLRYRRYIPAGMGQRNDFDVADRPVWVEVAIVSACYIALGTREETYLSLYAVGVFVLLSMTSWAAAKRIVRLQRQQLDLRGLLGFFGTIIAALLTSGATVIIFVERFTQGAWAYFLLIPLLYFWFSYVRWQLGEPVPLSDHLGRLHSGQYLLPDRRPGRSERDTTIEDVLVPLDGSSPAESALAIADILCRAFHSHLTLVSVDSTSGSAGIPEAETRSQAYLKQIAWQLEQSGLKIDWAVERGQAAEVINTVARDVGADIIVMTTHGHSNLEHFFVSDVAEQVLRKARSPVLLIRPTEQWRSRRTRFHRLLVGLDGSQSAESVLRYARTFAQVFESEILLLGVPEADFEEEELRKYLESVAQALQGRGLKTRAVVTGSGPARTIVAVSESEDADLVILAKNGRGTSSRGVALGSVADRVIQTTQRPLLLVDAPEGGSRIRRRHRAFAPLGPLS
jgi:nucleotide-binding universal stress UspA family protein